MQQKSKILDLIYGSLSYAETLEPNPDGGEYLDELVAAEEKLLPMINDNAEVSGLYDKVKKNLELISISETDYYFTEGFKMGLLIGIETGEWGSRKK